jgi:HemY protein
MDVAPHPDLASAFAAIAPDEDPAARIKRFHTFDEGASQSS